MLNVLTEIRQIIQEVRSNKSCASRVSASKVSKLVEATADLAEKKFRLKYLQNKVYVYAKQKIGSNRSS